MDLAIGVAVGSSMQIALLVLPISVILGWILGIEAMNLNFDGFQIAVLFVAVLLVNYLIADGVILSSNLPKCSIGLMIDTEVALVGRNAPDDGKIPPISALWNELTGCLALRYHCSRGMVLSFERKRCLGTTEAATCERVRYYGSLGRSSVPQLKARLVCT